MGIVYEAKCECGCELTVLSCRLDTSKDLCIQVEKCPDCAEKLETAEDTLIELQAEMNALQQEAE